MRTQVPLLSVTVPRPGVAMEPRWSHATERPVRTFLVRLCSWHDEPFATREWAWYLAEAGFFLSGGPAEWFIDLARARSDFLAAAAPRGAVEWPDWLAGRVRCEHGFQRGTSRTPNKLVFTFDEESLSRARAEGAAVGGRAAAAAGRPGRQSLPAG